MEMVENSQGAREHRLALWAGRSAGPIVWAVLAERSEMRRIRRPASFAIGARELDAVISAAVVVAIGPDHDVVAIAGGQNGEGSGALAVTLATCRYVARRVDGAGQRRPEPGVDEVGAAGSSEHDGVPVDGQRRGRICRPRAARSPSLTTPTRGAVVGRAAAARRADGDPEPLSSS